MNPSSHLDISKVILHCQRNRECTSFIKSVFDGIEQGNRIAAVTFDHGKETISFKSSFIQTHLKIQNI